MDVELLFVLGFVGVAGYFVVSGGRQLSTMFHILRNDPLAVSDLHGHRGPVEIEGRAIEGDGGTVTAPFTGATCLAYSYDVAEKDGKSWTTVDEGMGGTEFVVDDGSGRVRVDPTGADIRLESHSVEVPAGNRPSRPTRSLCRFDRGCRPTEQIARPAGHRNDRRKPTAVY